MASNSQLTLPRRTFDALPNHVWTLIISYLPRSSLPAVIATCKRFIKLATVPLYTPVVLHSEYSVLIKALETLCRQPSFARVVRVLVLRWTPSERPTDHTVFAKLLAYALKQTPSLEQLSVPQIPSIYHWMLAGVQLPKLTHLELSAYLAVNAQHFLESHRTSIQHLHLASEWAGTPAVVTKYHAHFSAETLARAKKLARLVVGVLPLAPSLVRAHAKTLTALALEDADESWHAAVDRAPLFRVCFEALAERAQLVHIALRHPHGLGSVARGIAGCCTLESVATVTLYVCPWAACRCSAARLVQKVCLPPSISVRRLNVRVGRRACEEHL